MKSFRLDPWRVGSLGPGARGFHTGDLWTFQRPRGVVVFPGRGLKGLGAQLCSEEQVWKPALVCKRAQLDAPSTEVLAGRVAAVGTQYL